MLDCNSATTKGGEDKYCIGINYFYMKVNVQISNSNETTIVESHNFHSITMLKE